MKHKYTIILKCPKTHEIIEAKCEDDAYKIACAKYGVNNFSNIEKYQKEGEFIINHKQFFLQRAISNTTKHIHAANRAGFKKKK